MKWDRERDSPLCLNITKSGLLLVNTRFATLVYNQKGKYVGLFKYNDPVSSFMCVRDKYLIAILSPLETNILAKAANYRVALYEIKE